MSEQIPAGMLKQLLTTAPDHHLDSSMVDLVKKWSDPPKAIELLEVIDKSIYAGLASEIILTLMQKAYTEFLKQENTTHEQLVQQAHWRNALN